MPAKYRDMSILGCYSLVSCIANRSVNAGRYSTSAAVQPDAFKKLPFSLYLYKIYILILSILILSPIVCPLFLVHFDWESTELPQTDVSQVFTDTCSPATGKQGEYIIRERNHVGVSGEDKLEEN